MKYWLNFLLLLLIVSCTSTQKVAEYRNAEFSSSNNFETFKFWRELDIRRFEENLLNVKIGIAAENTTLLNLGEYSYLQGVYDSIRIQIDKRNEAFQAFKVEYFDTTEQERLRLFKHLRSDSADLLFLDKVEEDSYFELYNSLIQRTISTLQQTSFYSSKRNFEDYIRNRSFIYCKKQDLIQIFGDGPILFSGISDYHWKRLKEQQVSYLILFSISFGIDFSEEARGHIGSERILLKLINVSTSELITSSEITRFWGNNLEDEMKSKETS